MSLVTEEIRAQAEAEGEVFYGPKICKEKVKELLAEVGLPNGLLPVDNIEECGRVKATGFVWFKRQVKKEYKFASIRKLISYAPEVTGYTEKNGIKKLHGVKSKELGIWVPINELYVKDPEKVTFKAPAGLYNTFPFSAFENDEAKELDEAQIAAEEAEDAKVEAGKVEEVKQVE